MRFPKANQKIKTILDKTKDKNKLTDKKAKTTIL